MADMYWKSNLLDSVEEKQESHFSVLGGIIFGILS